MQTNKNIPIPTVSGLVMVVLVPGAAVVVGFSTFGFAATEADAPQ